MSDLNCLFTKNKQLYKELCNPIKECISIDIHPSKKGPLTMKINGRYLYSYYDPIKDSKRFVDSQINEDTDVYCLFGFGLGYHVKHLLCNEPNKRIIVIEPYLSVIKKAAENVDLSPILSHQNVDILCLTEEKLPTKILNMLSNQRTQWIIPNAWLKALPQEHYLKTFLEDIKIRDMSINRFWPIMERNFKENLNHIDANIGQLFGKFNGQKAILVSAGPSLDDTVHFLKKLKGKYFILSVGSALKVLKKSGVIPDAVIITDPQEFVHQQLKDIEFSGPLIYLATACNSAVANHKGLKIIVFQKDCPLVERYAIKKKVPLVDTGGSVATTALDIIINMGFSEIVLVGQDLAYSKEHSHALQSTSRVEVVSNESLVPVLANDGTMVKSTTILSLYRRWFERKISQSKGIVFLNTAKKGAAIEGIPFIHISEIVSKSEKLRECNFNGKINSILTNN